MAQLDLDIALRLRRYELAVALTVGRETVALLGPSGAGKSTILRAVAGLQRPDRGRIAHGDEVWLDRDRRVDLPPERRSVGLVFQDYALFPHLSVRDNVAFGAPRGAPVEEQLERLRIGHLARERPGVLSGGERQRVALARALARGPGVLLLDEPLAALDAHTRAHVRAELLAVLSDAALPTLLVTHDVRDAMTLADRIGVLVDGRLRQLGTPEDVLGTPADAFVAELTGANVLPGTAADGTVTLDGGATLPAPPGAAGRVTVVVHPWDVHLGDGHGVVVRGTVDEVTPEGPRTRVRIGAVTAEVADEGAMPRRGDAGCLGFDPARARVLPT